jgi:hypothetical protein
MSPLRFALALTTALLSLDFSLMQLRPAQRKSYDGAAKPRRTVNEEGIFGIFGHRT